MSAPRKVLGVFVIMQAINFALAGVTTVFVSPLSGLGSLVIAWLLGRWGVGLVRGPAAPDVVALPPPAPTAIVSTAPPLRLPGPAPRALRGARAVGPRARDGRWIPPTHAPADERVAWLDELRVVEFAPDAAGQEGLTGAPRDLDAVALFLGVGSTDAPGADAPDGVVFQRFDALASDPAFLRVRGLVLGAWRRGACDTPPDAIWDVLIAGGPALGRLTHLFLGDASAHDVDDSGLALGDVGPVLSALPALEEAWLRGDTLALSGLQSDSLTHLAVQGPRLRQANVDQLLDAALPRLRSLVVWIGGDAHADAVDPARLPALLDRFPALEHLGLQNAARQDDVVEALLRHPGVARLRSLDLSLGALTERGARAILACEALDELEHLNLRHHYIHDPALRAALEELPFRVDLSDHRRDETPRPEWS